ncbi:hypothetical protein EVAR_83437_1 [Eumeta japonica]|uniref:Uncharacterized protein n=1 Tax=Eumeta variegata TaxID=151549 RepID=A0A4C1TZ84_EUMVA|nr:hypothetical protein EVAR_83437_1 [Eumeta japonica]
MKAFNAKWRTAAERGPGEGGGATCYMKLTTRPAVHAGHAPPLATPQGCRPSIYKICKAVLEIKSLSWYINVKRKKITQVCDGFV